MKEATEESECKCRHENTGSTPVDATEEGPSTFPSTSSTEARKRGNKHWWNYMSCNEVASVHKILYLRPEPNISIMIFFSFLLHVFHFYSRALVYNNTRCAMDRLQKANRIEQWSKLMPHGCHHIAILEKVVPFVFSHLSKNLDASTVLKIKSANFVCWLHTVGHTCIFLKDERHSARTIV